MESSLLILLTHYCLLASTKELSVKTEKMVVLPPGPQATLLSPLSAQDHVDRSGGERTMSRLEV